MTYTPTVWVDYGVPCVEATTLNNMETGIDIAQGDIMVLYGPTAAIPATDATLVGRLYFESDLLTRAWRDNGAGWDLVIDPTIGLPVTGQTTQYGGYADDGFYEWGIARDYTVLTLGQYAGNTNITLNAKVEAHSNNCVQDNVTGLMWSRTVSGPNIGPANNGLLPWTTNGAGEGIFTYIAAANAVSLAGHTDWRVPNIFELESIANMEVPSMAPDAVAFPAWPASRVFTSTTDAAAIVNALVVHFASSLHVRGLAKVNTYYCALVRT